MVFGSGVGASIEEIPPGEFKELQLACRVFCPIAGSCLRLPRLFNLFAVSIPRCLAREPEILESTYTARAELTARRWVGFRLAGR